jgi:hypothetical protein
VAERQSGVALMTDINWIKFPQCAERIKWSRTKRDGLEPYVAAVLVASYCHDDALTAFGGFNFDDTSDQNGLRLLERLEACIGAGKHKDKYRDFPNSLVSLIGARGVRTSELKSKADFVLCGQALFSPDVSGDVTFDGLEEVIRAIPKRRRKELADRNAPFLPADWIGKKFASPSVEMEKGAAA